MEDVETIVHRRRFIQGVSAATWGSSRVARGETSVRALTLRELLDASDAVLDGVVVGNRANWVEVFGARRVVTTWNLELKEQFFGALVAAEVATLGGLVGDLQQWVPHEAQLEIGARYLLFLRPGALGLVWVTGMAQGAFPLEVTTEDAWRVKISAEQAELASRSSSAVTALKGRSNDAVRRLIRQLA